jgi:hypothetical protein
MFHPAAKAKDKTIVMKDDGAASTITPVDADVIFYTAILVDLGRDDVATTSDYDCLLRTPILIIVRQMTVPKDLVVDPHQKLIPA